MGMKTSVFHGGNTRSMDGASFDEKHSDKELLCPVGLRLAKKCADQQKASQDDVCRNTKSKQQQNHKTTKNRKLVEGV